MDKIEKDDFINHLQEDAIADASKNWGLWELEKFAFDKYFHQADSILDIGCSTGRTTFALYKNGFHHITGLDPSPSKIQEARKFSQDENMEIPFFLGNATEIPFNDSSFDHALFSFHGLMKIPQRKNRILALKEIKRILRPGGRFLFTTPIRDSDERYLNFWEQEEMIWCDSKQDERLYEFGDIFTKGKSHQEEAYLHIPSQQEVLDCLEEAQLTVLETFHQDSFNESDMAMNFSPDSHFWIVHQ